MIIWNIRNVLDTPPPPNPKGQCPSGYQDLDPTSDYCYMVRARSVDLDGMSWGDANAQCIADGGSLASIHNGDHQQALENEVKKGSLDVWIGLQANSKFEYYVILDTGSVNGSKKLREK